MPVVGGAVGARVARVLVGVGLGVEVLAGGWRVGLRPGSGRVVHAAGVRVRVKAVAVRFAAVLLLLLLLLLLGRL